MAEFDAGRVIDRFLSKDIEEEDEEFEDDEDEPEDEEEN
jgi:hypothetical protein